MQTLTNFYYVWVAVAILLAVFSKSPAIALVLGAAISMTLGNPVKKRTGAIAKKALNFAIILLGFGLQINVVLRVGLASIWITMISITATMLVGYLLGKMLCVERDLSILLSSGTAICGGSAIAAMSPAIGASEAHTAVAMGIVFLLNGLGLLIFPLVGHMLDMSQTDFGLWSALAIHDTSSVVGAASIYGMQALAVGTTVKLTRALWILPLAFAGSKINKSENKSKFPWFLIGFLLAAVLRSYMPQFDVYFTDLAHIGKRMMVFTLFLIGAGITVSELKKIGYKPLVMSVVLWGIVSMTSLLVIMEGWTHFHMPV